METLAIANLTADRGDRIETSIRWLPIKLNRMFERLWSQTTTLSKDSRLQHGDIYGRPLAVRVEDTLMYAHENNSENLCSQKAS